MIIIKLIECEQPKTKIKKELSKHVLGSYRHHDQLISALVGCQTSNLSVGLQTNRFDSNSA